MIRNTSILALATLLALGCSKKSTSELPPQNVQGYWMGYYGNPNSYPTVTYNFLFRSNGTVRVYEQNTDTAQAGKAEGTYAMSGSTMTATYTFVNSTETYSVAATVNAQYTYMDGNWGLTPTSLTSGDFLLVRQLQ